MPFPTENVPSCASAVASNSRWVSDFICHYKNNLAYIHVTNNWTAIKQRAHLSIRQAVACYVGRVLPECFHLYLRSRSSARAISPHEEINE